MIVTHLLTDPPSTTTRFAIPSFDALCQDPASWAPLKSLSSLNHAWRAFILPMLFRHMRLGFDDLLHVVRAEETQVKRHDKITPRSSDLLRSFSSAELQEMPFLAFYTRVKPIDRPESLLLVAQSTPENESRTLSLDYISSAWEYILNLIMPQCVVLVAAPMMLANLCGYLTQCGEPWAYGIKYQRMELSHADGRFATPWPGRTPRLPLLTLRPWSAIAFHQGSSASVYRHYHFWNFTSPESLLGDDSDSAPHHIRHLGAHVTSFTYSTLFPLRRHFRVAVSNIESIRFLEELSLQLVPLPDEEIFTDSESIGRGTTRLRDAWAEVEMCYESVCRSIGQGHLPCLARLISRDCHIDDIKQCLDGLLLPPNDPARHVLGAGYSHCLSWSLVEEHATDEAPSPQWTYIAHQNLLKALANFRASHPDPAVTFTVQYRPYQLHPGLPAEGTPKRGWYLANMYRSPEQLTKYETLMSGYGHESGIDFAWSDDAVIANTFDALRCLMWVQEEKGTEASGKVIASLYSQYFEQARHPSSAETLTTALSAGGISHEEAKGVVDDHDVGRRDVEALIREQAGNGVDAVPYVIVEGRRRDFTVQGMKTAEEYEKILTSVLKESS
ncbi:hypothetical protein MRB53_038121 [Persea americana]|nr:hypothetical protein MRB53_038121 [Persea americana]